MYPLSYDSGSADSNYQPAGGYTYTPSHHSSEQPQLTPSEMADAHHARRAALSSIGRPIQFVSGQFAGQTIRAELIEVQKADLGRKYAKVDRRPLDPPPAVLLRLYFVYNVGTENETEKEIENYDDVQNLGLLCNVDLFPVPGLESKGKDAPDGRHAQHASSSQTTYSSAPPPHYSSDSHHAYGQDGHAYQHNSVTTSGFSSLSAQPQTIPGYLPPSNVNPDIVAHIGNYPIAEGSKCTGALVGATFVQPANVDYRGRKSLIFVFADLAVKIEGTFILRYRLFDIFSKTYGSQDLVVQAECYGGPFRVYSTKEFPGLHASTDLTKQLARWGVRLNIRETERKRRKKGEQGSVSPPHTGKGKGKDPLNDSRDDNSQYAGRYGSDDD